MYKRRTRIYGKTCDPDSSGQVIESMGHYRNMQFPQCVNAYHDVLLYCKKEGR